MKIAKLMSALAGAAFALHAGSAAVTAETAATPKKLFAAEMQWVPMAEGSPLKIVALWGDHTKDADYGMLVKMPAGFSTGMHSHSSDYDSIEIQGKKIHRSKDEATSEPYTAGSYSHETPGHVHEDVCLGPEDCIVFIHQGKKFDFIPDKK